MMDRQLRILSCCGRYGFGGGAEYMLHKMHRVLQARGHEVTVMSIARGAVGRTVLDGVTVLQQPVSFGRELLVQVKKLNPDIILCQWLRFSASLVYWAAEQHVPVVMMAHNPGNWPEIANVGLAEKVDLFIFNGPYLRDLAGRNVRHLIVTPPIEQERVLAATRRPRYVTLVNLCEAKGAEIFYALAKRFPKHEFLGVEGGYNKQIRQDLKNVTIRKHSPDMRAVYGETRVLLMPSKFETYGMAGAEAQANGIPVLATDLVALRDALGDGAVYLPEGKIAAWTKALARLDQPAYYARRVVQARANAARNGFDQDMQELDFVLHDLVRHRDSRVRPGVEGLLREHAALAAYIKDQFLQYVGRAPTAGEVARVIESSDRPDDALEALLEECTQCTVRATAISG